MDTNVTEGEFVAIATANGWDFDYLQSILCQVEYGDIPVAIYAFGGLRIMQKELDFAHLIIQYLMGKTQGMEKTWVQYDQGQMVSLANNSVKNTNGPQVVMWNKPFVFTSSGEKVAVFVMLFPMNATLPHHLIALSTELCSCGILFRRKDDSILATLEKSLDYIQNSSKSDLRRKCLENITINTKSPCEILSNDSFIFESYDSKKDKDREAYISCCRNKNGSGSFALELKHAEKDKCLCVVGDSQADNELFVNTLVNHFFQDHFIFVVDVDKAMLEKKGTNLEFLLSNFPNKDCLTNENLNLLKHEKKLAIVLHLRLSELNDHYDDFLFGSILMRILKHEIFPLALKIIVCTSQIVKFVMKLAQTPICNKLLGVTLETQRQIFAECINDITFLSVIEQNSDLQEFCFSPTLCYFIAQFAKKYGVEKLGTCNFEFALNLYLYKDVFLPVVENQCKKILQDFESAVKQMKKMSPGKFTKNFLQETEDRHTIGFMCGLCEESCWKQFAPTDERTKRMQEKRSKLSEKIAKLVTEQLLLYASDMQRPQQKSRKKYAAKCLKFISFLKQTACPSFGDALANKDSIEFRFIGVTLLNIDLLSLLKILKTTSHTTDFLKCEFLEEAFKILSENAKDIKIKSLALGPINRLQVEETSLLTLVPWLQNLAINDLKIRSTRIEDILQHTEQLSELDLSGNELRSDHMNVICKNFQKFKKLRLESCKLSHSLLENLAQACSETELTLLDISNNDIGKTFYCFANSKTKQLIVKSGKIVQSYLDKFLQAALRHETKFMSLDLSSNKNLLKDSMQSVSLTEITSSLILDDCNVDSQSLKAFLPPKQAMELLSLAKNNVEESGMSVVAQSMTEIKAINLSKCKIGHNGLIDLIKGYKDPNSIVETLDLSSNDLSNFPEKEADDFGSLKEFNLDYCLSNVGFLKRAAESIPTLNLKIQKRRQSAPSAVKNKKQKCTDDELLPKAQLEEPHLLAAPKGDAHESSVTENDFLTFHQDTPSYSNSRMDRHAEKNLVIVKYDWDGPNFGPESNLCLSDYPIVQSKFVSSTFCLPPMGAKTMKEDDLCISGCDQKTFKYFEDFVSDLFQNTAVKKYKNETCGFMRIQSYVKDFCRRFSNFEKKLVPASSHGATNSNKEVKMEVFSTEVKEENSPGSSKKITTNNSTFKGCLVGPENVEMNDSPIYNNSTVTNNYYLGSQDN